MRTERTRQSTDAMHPLNGHLGVVSRMKSRKSFIKCTEPINTTAKAARMELWIALGHQCSSDKHLPAGAENTSPPGQTGRPLKRLRTQVGRARVNMPKWGYSNETDT